MYSSLPSYWETEMTACGGFSTPDLQPGFWDTYLVPHNGNSYIGLVARTNQTSEGFFQNLISPLSPDLCYSFSIHLAKAPFYEFHPNPGTLEIWAGNNGCDRQQLLWASPEVTHGEWRAYEITFMPLEAWTTISFLIKGYASNILIDDIQHETTTELNASFTGSETICEGSTAILQIAAPEGSSFEWSNGETNPEISISTPGHYEVTIEKNGCKKTVTTEIYSTPLPRVHLSPDSVVLFHETTFYDIVPTNELNLPLQWNTGETSPTLRVHETGMYSVTATNECGLAKDSIHVTFISLFIPNVVTANHDGKNDVFVIQGMEPGTIELMIYNRWGEMIYYNNAYNNNWPESDVTAGVYYFTVKSRKSDKVFRDVLSVILD
jgi:gliding motility-associated-like protein